LIITVGGENKVIAMSETICKDIPLSTKFREPFNPNLVLFNKKKLVDNIYNFLVFMENTSDFEVNSILASSPIIFSGIQKLNPFTAISNGKLNSLYIGSTSEISIEIKSGILTPNTTKLQTPLIDLTLDRPSQKGILVHGLNLYNSFLINITDPSGKAMIAAFSKNLQGGTLAQDYLVPVYGNPQEASYIGYKRFLLNAPNSAYSVEISCFGHSNYHLTSIGYNTDSNPELSPSSSIIVKTNNEKFIATFTTTITNTRMDYYFINGKKIYNPLKLYPYGYVGGNFKSLNFSRSLFLPKYSNVNKIEIVTMISGSSLYVPLLDQGSPYINSIDIIPLINGKYLIRTNLSCGQYGLKSLNFESFKKIIASDLVYGDNTNGIYEKVVYMLSPVYNYQLITNYPFTTPIISSLFHNFEKGIRFYDIKTFYFEKNDIDLSFGGVWNTLYLNSTNPDTTTIIPFKLISTTEIGYNVINDDFEWDFLRWDFSLKMYKLNFYIPARIFTGPVHYYIYIQGIMADATTLSTFLPSSSLNVISSYADEMPPIINSIEVSSSQQTNNIQTVVWKIKITDPLNGLESGNLTINSDVDYLGYQFTFGPCDSIDPKTLYLSLNLTLI